LAEQQILREAVELATASQRKTISNLMTTITRRVDEIEEDEAVIVLLT
jgi:histone H3/H4